MPRLVLATFAALAALVLAAAHPEAAGGADAFAPRARRQAPAKKGKKAGKKGMGGNVDSFFDITYLTLPQAETAHFNVDSFFDIYRVAAQDSSGFTVDSFFDITYRAVANIGSSGLDGVSRARNGMGGGLCGNFGGNFNVDSFFDIAARSADAAAGGQSPPRVTADRWWQHNLRAFHAGWSTNRNGNFNVDSFFDIFVEVAESAGVDPPLANPCDFDGDMEAALHRIDSFFDVFYDRVQLSCPVDANGVERCDYVDSFFDVFYRAGRNAGRNIGSSGQDGVRASFNENIFKEIFMRTAAVMGQQTQLPSDTSPPRPNFTIDSFFDVFMLAAKAVRNIGSSGQDGVGG